MFCSSEVPHIVSIPWSLASETDSLQTGNFILQIPWSFPPLPFKVLSMEEDAGSAEIL